MFRPMKKTGGHTRFKARRRIKKNEKTGAPDGVYGRAFQIYRTKIRVFLKKQKAAKKITVFFVKRGGAFESSQQ